MSEKELADSIERYLISNTTGPSVAAIEIASMAIEHFRTIHSKALACHCECLGMNAENCMAACIDTRIPYGNEHYRETMRKWGLMNEKGEPII